MDEDDGAQGEERRAGQSKFRGARHCTGAGSSVTVGLPPSDKRVGLRWLTVGRVLAVLGSLVVMFECLAKEKCWHSMLKKLRHADA